MFSCKNSVKPAKTNPKYRPALKLQYEPTNSDLEPELQQQISVIKQTKVHTAESLRNRYQQMRASEFYDALKSERERGFKIEETERKQEWCKKPIIHLYSSSKPLRSPGSVQLTKLDHLISRKDADSHRLAS